MIIQSIDWNSGCVNLEINAFRALIRGIVGVMQSKLWAFTERGYLEIILAKKLFSTKPWDCILLSFGKIQFQFKNFFLLGSTFKKFKRFAKSNRLKSLETNNVVLVEYRPWAVDYIGLVAFLPSLLKHFNANSVFYEMTVGIASPLLKKRFKHFFSLGNAISRSKFVIFFAKKKFKRSHEELIALWTSGSLTKRQFLNINYKGVQIGDLIYDFYLRKTKNFTIVFEDPNLKFLISSFLQYFDKIEHYLAENQVKAVVVSHSCYHFGIPARLALSKDIEVFVVDMLKVVRLDKKHPFDLKQIYDEGNASWKRLSTKTKGKGLLLGKTLAEKRLDGSTLEDLVTIPKNSEKIDLDDLLNKEKKEDVIGVIALHDFHDSPNGMGEFYYPDFLEWLVDAASLTSSSRKKWLVKPHPYAIAPYLNRIQDLISKFPHLILIPDSISNRQLAEFGIKFCLTVHGSIAQELSLLGCYVVTASPSGPYSKYNFTIESNSVDEYRKLILNLGRENFHISKNSVYEFYFMRFVFNLICWSIQDYPEFLKNLGAHAGPDNEKSISLYFLHQKLQLTCLRNTVENFLLSGDKVLGRRHFSPTKCPHPDKCSCKSMQTANGIFEYDEIEKED